MSFAMCEECKYFYTTKIDSEKTSYEALMDRYITILAPGVLTRCCGLEPTAIMLDDEQPVCRHFEESQDKEQGRKV